ncbi:hypothetical protein, variant [Blastomyces gilchristii SLH14081]|nr:hypothetical protein, variant [Blastomyces gilchristii SLH14081]OAT07839.1 hypothetical protein, variant [Blastomyces gilchristii SLH14081]
MRAFLEHLSIIEGKLPSIPAYRSHVMLVFLALLSGKWAKAFRDVGNDEDLQSAKSTMKESLAQLESASLTVILTTTQDLKQDTNTIVTQTERIDSRTERIEVSILAQREEFHDIWVLDEEAYQVWREGTTNPYLWISGDTRLGKTSAAFLLSKELEEAFASEPKTSIAAFDYQDDQAEFMSVSNAFSSMIIQIAGGNSGYCEQASSEAGKDGGVDTDDWTDLWERLLPIQIRKRKLRRDMTLLIEGRLRRFQNLYEFGRRTKKKILSKLLEKSDSMLYVDHMLRRYNSIGREGMVLKDLETSFPDSLQSAYNILLTEAQQRRTSEHLQYSSSCYCGWRLQNSVIKEVEGKSSSNLRITRSKKTETRRVMIMKNFLDDGSIASNMIADDNAATLQFLDRSLRGYFRSGDVGESGLRKPSSAHLTMFATSVDVICDRYNSAYEAGGKELKDYAINFWADHFLELDPVSATELDLLRVIESLSLVLNDHNNAAKELELGLVYPRGHISNWFQQIHAESESFRFASDEKAYRAIGLILKDYGHYDAGIVACAALGISISEADRFRTLVVLVQVYAKLYDDEEGDESDNDSGDISDEVSDVESNSGNAGNDPNQYNAIAYKTICEALSSRPSSVDDPTTEEEARLLIREALLIQGDCERAMDRVDEAVKSYGEARIICSSEILDGVSLNEIKEILGEQSRFVELMENVEQ